MTTDNHPAEAYNPPKPKLPRGIRLHELKDLQLLCGEIQEEDRQSGRDPSRWKLPLSRREARFIELQLELCGARVRLPARSGICWCRLEGKQWVGFDDGPIHEGRVQAVWLCYDYCPERGAHPTTSAQPAIEIVDDLGRAWLVPLHWLEIDKCERVDGEPGVVDDLVPILS